MKDTAKTVEEMFDQWLTGPSLINASPYLEKKRTFCAGFYAGQVNTENKYLDCYTREQYWELSERLTESMKEREEMLKDLEFLLSGISHHDRKEAVRAKWFPNKENA